MGQKVCPLLTLGKIMQGVKDEVVCLGVKCAWFIPRDGWDHDYGEDPPPAGLCAIVYE